MESEDKKITINEAAVILCVHPNTIRNYIEKGILDAYELPTGKRILLLENDVKNLIQKKDILG